MDIYDVVTKLVGSIRPVGETNEDERRFENLKIMVDLVDRLLTDIDEVGSLKNDYRDSLKKAGKYADTFMTSIGIED